MKLLLVHAFATVFMVGLIWLVQVVHYPLFSEVGAEKFARYEQLHSQRITWVVLPVMLVELTCAIAIIRTGQQPVLAWSGMILLAVIWASTFALQVPQHEILTAGFDATAHRRLVATNWIRTFGWTARGAIALVMLYFQYERAEPFTP